MNTTPTSSQRSNRGTSLQTIQEARIGLEKMRSNFANTLPKHISADKFEKIVLTALSQTPGLLSADRKSFFTACSKAASDGLVPDGREGAFVIFKNKAGQQIVQWMPMVYGLIKKARQSGEVSKIGAELVYSADEFEVTLGDEEKFVHKPNYRAGDRGKLELVYAYVAFKDGSVQREVMTLSDVQKVRNVSRSKDSGPWVSWFEEMAKKTALRRLSKYLPLSSEDRRAFEQMGDDIPTEYQKQKQAALDALKSQASGVAQIEAQPTDDDDGETVDPVTGEVLDGDDSQPSDDKPVPDTEERNDDGEEEADAETLIAEALSTDDTGEEALQVAKRLLGEATTAVRIKELDEVVRGEMENYSIKLNQWSGLVAKRTSELLKKKK